jgi:hypothetical protein|tara:strand:- start:28 stop:642 length:615 start_codon:yes stop_codon:yes gene_type:complete
VSENLQKFIGIAVMAVIVVVGVVATNDDDSDFTTTRNAAFVKLGDIKGEVKDDGAASKGGDCCDETLYRLGEIEDRLSQIETSLQQALPLVRDAQLVDDGPTVEELLVALENFAGQRLDDMNAGALADVVVADSRLLVGVPLQTAQQVVRSLGLGFRHESQDGRDLNPVQDFGIRRDPDGRMAAILVHTRDGVVFMVEVQKLAP